MVIAIGLIGLLACALISMKSVQADENTIDISQLEQKLLLLSSLRYFQAEKDSVDIQTLIDGQWSADWQLGAQQELTDFGNEDIWIHLRKEINNTHNIPDQCNDADSPETPVNTANALIVHRLLRLLQPHNARNSGRQSGRSGECSERTACTCYASPN